MPTFALAASAVAAVAAAFVILLVAERVRPLRPPTQPRARRFGIAAGFAATSALATGLAYRPVVFAAAMAAERHGVGLLRWAEVPRPVRAVVAFVLLDYSLWLWHRLNHRVPLLWRFHAAHHADLDLDVMTAWRFHFGEMLATVPFRAAQAVVVGVDLPVLVLWEIAVLFFAELHHSNVRLPLALERVLRLVVVTPRLHGIHHATDARDVSSNFGTLLSVWDRLHGAHRWAEGPPQAIGLAELRDPRALTLVRALALPFSRAPLVPPRVPR